MTLLEFKTIYWWEWGHRQLGRVVGLVWLIGFVWLAVGKKMSGIWTTRSLIIGGLGGLQGAIGWWMVSSGLSGRMVDVASYRLAVHLGIAFLIITLITWYLLQANISDQERIRSRREREKNLIPITNILLGFVFLQIIVGALVAGIDAGRGYTDWPLMNGEFLPTESFSYTPILSNFTENPALVQFNHRLIGYLTVLYTIFVWWRCRSSSFDATKRRSNLVLLIVFLQMIMGIATVIYAAPLGWAIVHQFGAILIIVFVQSLRSQISFPKKQLVQL
jgi:cytochrome c oxidase assembly protein subunit 15